MITQESQNWGSKLILKVKDRIPDNYRRTTSGRRKTHQRWELEQRTIKQFSWTIEQLTICFIPQHPLWWSACPPPHHLLLHGPSCKAELKRTALDGESWNLNWIGRPVEPVPDQNVHMSQNYMKVTVSLVWVQAMPRSKEGFLIGIKRKQANTTIQDGEVVHVHVLFHIRIQSMVNSQCWHNFLGIKHTSRVSNRCHSYGPSVYHHDCDSCSWCLLWWGKEKLLGVSVIHKKQVVKPYKSQT